MSLLLLVRLPKQVIIITILMSEPEQNQSGLQRFIEKLKTKIFGVVLVLFKEREIGELMDNL